MRTRWRDSSSCLTSLGTSVEGQTVAFHQGYADGPARGVALVFAVQIALPRKQLALLVQVLLPVSAFSFQPPAVPAAVLGARAVLARPVGLSGLHVLRVLPAEDGQAVHAVVGDVVSEELGEAGGHHPHTTAFVTYGNNRKDGVRSLAKAKARPLPTEG